MQQGSAVGGGVCSNFFSPSIPLAHAYAAPFSAPCNWAPLFGRPSIRVHSRRQRTLAKHRKVGGRSSFFLVVCVVCLMLRRQHPSSCTAAGKGCASPATCDHMDAVCVCVCVSMPGTPPSTAATCLSRLAGAPCPDIIDMSHYSRRDREAFARSGELKQRVAGLAWTA